MYMNNVILECCYYIRFVLLSNDEHAMTKYMRTLLIIIKQRHLLSYGKNHNADLKINIPHNPFVKIAVQPVPQYEYQLSMNVSLL